MVALPETQSPTIGAIEAAVAIDRHKPRLSASMLEGECDRAIWYAFRWAASPEPKRGKTARSGEIAMAVKPLVIQWLGSAGVMIDAVDPASGQDHSVTDLDGHFYAPVDAFCTGIVEAPKKRHLLIAAALNAASFRQVQKHGVAAAKPGHFKRAQLLMHLTGADRTAYAFANRDDGQIGLERIRRDTAIGAAMHARAERIKGADEAPIRISDDPEYFTCRMCPARGVCHEGERALRNCRTCLYASPIGGGRWHCMRHDRDLTIDDQRAGCPNHLFLPSLVAGDQIDADEASETVTYAMADGSTWVDGGEREGRAA